MSKKTFIIIPGITGGVAGGFQLGWFHAALLGGGVVLLWLSVDLFRQRHRPKV